ncbi:MAG TPA: hypothetical protein DHV36_12080, partial [Desulfobacteraceae bacterium]|nr:hypothetical protein [Desulfobacteraceae bacterium]
MTTHFSFLCRTKTSAGTNALEHLPFELSGMGAKKPMVIQDAASRKLKRHKCLIRAFKDSGMTLGIAPAVPEPALSGSKKKPEATAQFIRDMYATYREKGYDAIIAVGKAAAADMAKALNIAVTLGPDALKGTDITAPLNPLIYIPTGVDTVTATAASVTFNRKAFTSPYLAPDQAVIDPAMLIPDDRDSLLDAALFCLALGCEVHALSGNPPARAYAAALVELAAVPLAQMIGSYSESNLKLRKKAEAGWQKQLVQAAVISGYLTDGSRPLLTLALGREISGDSGRVSLGMIMTVLLPAVLETLGRDRFGSLLLPLSGMERFSTVPVSQQPVTAVQTIRGRLNGLHAVTGGHTPRTLAEAGWQRDALT